LRLKVTRDVQNTDLIREKRAVNRRSQIMNRFFLRWTGKRNVFAYNNCVSTIALPNAARRDATIILLVAFAHGTSHFFHLMLPPLFPWFMREYSLSYTQVGALMTVFFAVSGTGQALAGFLVDRWGAHRVLCLGISLLASSGFLIAAAPGVWGLYLAAFAAGLGNSVFHPADFSLLNHRVSQPRLGHAFSAHGLAGNLGWASGPLIMTATATAAGWRTAGLVAALIGCTSLAMVVWRRRDLAIELEDEAHETPREKKSEGSLSRLLQMRLTWVAFGFFFFSTLVLGAVENFGPSLLRDLYGLSLAAATSGLTSYLVGGAAGLVVGGFLVSSGKVQETVVGLCFLGSAALALLLALVVAPGWSVIGIMAAMGFGVGVAGPSRDMLVRKSTVASLGKGAFGRIYGLVYSGADVGLATAPLIFGMLMDASKQRFVFAGVSIALAISIVAAQAIARVARQAEASSELRKERKF
jgi:MFS transporter, FSR family, fosmidomycin resistance protein